MEVLQNFFHSSQTSTVDLQKAFLVIILQFWERIAKNEDLLGFSQYKKIWYLIRRHDAIFWKAYDLGNRFDTHYVTFGCFKRKLRPLFRKKFL